MCNILHETLQFCKVRLKRQKKLQLKNYLNGQTEVHQDSADTIYMLVFGSLACKIIHGDYNFTCACVERRQSCVCIKVQGTKYIYKTHTVRNLTSTFKMRTGSTLQLFRQPTVSSKNNICVFCYPHNLCTTYQLSEMDFCCTCQIIK